MAKPHSRKLAAILAADVVGYSRLMNADEVGTLDALKAHLAETMEPHVAERGGRIFKTTGDGMLAEFSSAVAAVECAVAVQRDCAARNEKVASRKAPTVPHRHQSRRCDRRRRGPVRRWREYSGPARGDRRSRRHQRISGGLPASRRQGGGRLHQSRHADAEEYRKSHVGFSRGHGQPCGAGGGGVAGAGRGPAFDRGSAVRESVRRQEFSTS